MLAGARRALGEGRITHVVFEDHVGADSAVARTLIANGYRILSVGWSVRGLRLGEDPRERLATPYEAPSFVASSGAATKCMDAVPCPGLDDAEPVVQRSCGLERHVRASA